MRFLFLACCFLCGLTTGAAEIKVTATFECAGVEWVPNEKASHECRIRFRELGNSNWTAGFPLWRDNHTSPNSFRGSIVNLAPGKSYELEVRSGTETASTTFRTWSEEFPIGTVTGVEPTRDKPLFITTSGTPTAWRVYEPIAENSTIDVAGQHASCIRIEDASYIIIRNLNLRGANRHGIELVGNVHDIVIENCDISNWGSIESDGWGHNNDSGIFSRSHDLERIVVQRCRIHDPRGGTNSWAELRPTSRDPDNHHPLGPQAITFAHSKGNHVLRFNHVWSDDDHQFNDIFGGSDNYSTVGFPNRDSDIYGNRLSHCWDDAIESEGGNRNVRIWNNHIDQAYVGVATATTSVGPLYIWRNVVGEMRRDFGEAAAPDHRGSFIKTSDRLGGGRIYVFHNTLLQPTHPRNADWALGCQYGMGHGGSMCNIMSRNNIFHTSAKGAPFHDRMRDPLGDYDYDLFNGHLQDTSHERHGIAGIPKYEPLEKIGTAELQLPLACIPSKESLVVDKGIQLPNFNDDYYGEAPDLGAFERRPRD